MGTNGKYRKLLNVNDINELINTLEEVVKGLIEVTDKDTLEKIMNTTDAKGLQYMIYKLQHHYISNSEIIDNMDLVLNSVHIYGELLKDKLDYLVNLLKDVKELSNKINVDEKECKKDAVDNLDERLMRSRVYMVLHLYLGYPHDVVNDLYEQGLINKERLLELEELMIIENNFQR